MPHNRMPHTKSNSPHYLHYSHNASFLVAGGDNPAALAPEALLVKIILFLVHYFFNRAELSLPFRKSVPIFYNAENLPHTSYQLG